MFGSELLAALLLTTALQAPQEDPTPPQVPRPSSAPS